MIRRYWDSFARASCAAPAAPAGGASASWCRGCGIAALISLWTVIPAQASQDIPVPSGQRLTLNEVFLDDAPGALWVRFRFLAPQIARDAGDVDFETAGPDMDFLCQSLALPYLAHHTLEPERVVISLSDRAVPFGEQDPAATQFFETYSLRDGVCIWEEF